VELIVKRRDEDGKGTAVLMIIKADGEARV
jgi:hypothetical protein